MAAPRRARADAFSPGLGPFANVVIDGSRFLTPLPLSAGTGLAASALTAYAQDAGLNLLDAAVRSAVQALQAELATNQYYRGYVTVLLPPGLIPLAATHTLSAGRARYVGQGTLFAKVGSDYGDMLHFKDFVTLNSVYSKGGTELRDFSCIDLTATTNGALVFCDAFEFGRIVNLKLHNGFENLVVSGCNNTKFLDVHSRSDGDLGGTGSTGSSGKFLSGSTLLSLRTAYNGDIEFIDCNFAGGDPSHRYTHDAILIQSADVVTFSGGEHGCVSRATVHINAVSGLSNQVVKMTEANLDNATGVQIFVDGSTAAAFGQNSRFDVQCFKPDNNFVNIANTAYAGADFHIDGLGATKEAIVCKGSSCTFSGKLRGVGTSATANGQFSAIWLGSGAVNTVRDMDIEGSATFSLAYGVEIVLGGYGVAVQSSVVVPGGSALGAVSYNDGTLDLTGLVVAGGAPKTPTSSSAARTTPTVIT